MKKKYKLIICIVGIVGVALAISLPITLCHHDNKRDLLNLSFDTSNQYKTTLTDQGDKTRIIAYHEGSVSNISLDWTAYNENDVEDKIGCPVFISHIDNTDDIIFTLNNNDLEWNGHVVVSSFGTGSKGNKIESTDLSFNIVQRSVIPITKVFYDIDNNGTIDGFAPEFLSHSNTSADALAYLNANGVYGNIMMSLVERHITYKEYAFSPNLHVNVNNIYSNIYFLNLSHSVFLYDKTPQSYPMPIYTGLHTFADALFPNLKSIDLSYADFVSDTGFQHTNATTGDETFLRLNAPLLTSIDLNHAVFMKTGMSGSQPPPNFIYTASGTFHSANIPSVVNLDLSFTDFAVDLYSGSTSYSYFNTANQTFMNCNLSSLQTLNMSSTNLFGTQGFITDYLIACSTFESSQLTNLNKLYLPPKDYTYQWKQTFNSITIPGLPGVIYNHASRPTWFDNGWFSGWQWIG